jgi:hypothetical protein
LRRQCGAHRPGVAAGLAVALSLAAASAGAQMTKDQCVDSNTIAQHLRLDGKLSQARERLRACANPSCPALVRDDCTQRLDELERAQPTIIFEAKDGSGREVQAVSVTVDGQPLAEKLDGTPLRVDPGEHVFVFTAPDQPPVTQTFVLKEGDKQRSESLAIGAATPVAIPPPSPEGAPPSTPALGRDGEPEGGADGKGPGGLGTQKTVGIVAGGAGAVSIAVGGVFGLMTLSKANAQRADCASATNCANYSQAASDHSTGATDRTISAVSFVAGGLLLVGGVVLFFTADHASAPPAATGLLVVPSVAPGAGGMLLMADF